MQALQHEVIQKGLVINSQLYDAHLHDHGTQVRQCFNCGQWGHKQSACGKTAKMQYMRRHTPNHGLPEEERLMCELWAGTQGMAERSVQNL